MNIYYISALLAALCWAITPLINTFIVRDIGVNTAMRWKVLISSISLWALTLYNGTFYQLMDSYVVSVAVLSGLIGVFIGDTALFLAIKHIGGRRMSVLYTLATPFVIVLGYVFLDESLSLQSLLACTTIMAGVIIVILYRENTSQHRNNLDVVTGSLALGVFWGIIAALGQAIGIVLSRPIMNLQVDPLAFSALRISAALVPILLFRFIMPASFKPKKPLQFIHYWYMTLIAFLSLTVGMTLAMFALSGGKAGIITTLTGTTPVFVLPIVWYATRVLPSLGAWLGAILAVVGTAILSI